MPNLWNIDRLLPGPDRVVPGDTLPAMFWHAAAGRGDRTWLRQKELGLWRSWSWNDTATAVREIAHGLMALGFERGQTASIMSNTVVEWVLADLAVLSCGGVSSGIYPTDATAQVHYLCDDSRTTVLFVEDDEQLDKALQCSEQLAAAAPRSWCSTWKDWPTSSIRWSMSLDALRASGREHLAQHPSALEERVAAVQPEDLAILVYTSGTTGKPKGAMHLHGGLTFYLREVNKIVGQDETDERMCFLPLCHVAERTGGEYFGMYTGPKLNFVENPDTVPENVREIAPTVFTAVPRVWEKFYSAVTIAVREASPVAADGLSLGAGGRPPGGRARGAGSAVPAWLKAKFMLARWLALDNVRRLVGIHRARFLSTGAAPISPDLIRWYLALGVPMFEVWGMTETVRPVDLDAGLSHQARLDRQGRAVQRGAHRRRPLARSWCAARTCSRAT